MKFVICLVGLLVSSCFSCAHLAPGKQYDIKDAYVSVGQLSVTSKDGKSGIYATGFAIDDTHVLAARHFCVGVVEESAKDQLQSDKISLTVVHNDILLTLGEILEIKEINEKLDACILYGEHGMLPFEFSSSRMSIGDKISVIGGPLSFFPVFSEGRVIVPKYDLPKVGNGLLFLGVHVSHGSSGSPVLNEFGKVVGMIVVQLVPHPVLSADCPFAIAQRGDVLLKWINSVLKE